MDNTAPGSGDGNRRDQGKRKRAFDYMKNAFRRSRESGESSQTAGDQQNTEREKHEMMHERISRFLGMEDDHQRQVLWNLMKEDEKDDIAIYMTTEIRERLSQQKVRNDEEEVRMMDEFDSGNLQGGTMNARINALALEYNQQEMLYVLEEINRRINQ